MTKNTDPNTSCAAGGKRVAVEERADRHCAQQGQLLVVAAMEARDEEVHLLVALEPAGELHATAERHVFDGDLAGHGVAGGIEARLPLGKRRLALRKARDLLLDEARLVGDQALGALEVLPVEVCADRIHAEPEVPELLDAGELVHVREAVDAVAVRRPRRREDAEALVVAQRIDADAEEPRDLADGIAVLDAR